MPLSPDNYIVFTIGGLAINKTITNTWVVMALLTGVSYLITRNLRPDVPPSRWRITLEVIVSGIQDQIAEITQRRDRQLLSFVGTLFLFIFTSNLMTVVPGFDVPTGSLSTTTALALSVLVAVPLFGMSSHGMRAYLRTYLEPSFIMLPFNIVSELLRAISLAMRLYGNIMSGGVIVAVLLSVAPFFFPVMMSMLSLLTGVIQAYIFSVLATVYISSAMAAQTTKVPK
ncbi:ATP synthase F0F1 subunit A [Steroidobacter denitrificans]|uniref:ATP synthase subunit a n=1 Tax=Steroidobacter denitrificans TaxID=465721 RepID=A0A127FE21_STEDE|nr:F0F1 ATP synthase subunit A [Steroidobacter denitrificans]AMN47999.1 ATP synthase F0F1 subunit A [Steroidobacter denitrificans]